MDKPKLSIKINGKKRSFYETTSDKHEKVEHQEEGDFQDTYPKTKHETQQMKPIHDEPRLAKEEVASANEKREFDWILPQQNQYSNEDWSKTTISMDELRKKRNPIFDSIYVPSKQKKKRNDSFPIKTLLLAIISALVIGTSFGMMVLHLFTGNRELPADGTKQPAEAVTTPGESAGEEATKGNEGQTALVSIPALNIFVVQGGVYSSEAAVTPIVDQMKSNGLAGTIINQDSKYYLFLGLGSSDQAAKAIRTPYEAHVEGPFVKHLLTEEQNGDPSILQAKQLFEQLVSYTSNLYLSMPESINWEEVKKTNDVIKSKDSNSTGDTFVKSVKKAYTKAETYKTSSAIQDFWITQQTLLNSYQFYQKWIMEQKIE